MDTCACFRNRGPSRLIYYGKLLLVRAVTYKDTLYYTSVVKQSTTPAAFTVAGCRSLFKDEPLLLLKWDFGKIYQTRGITIAVPT